MRLCILANQLCCTGFCRHRFVVKYSNFSSFLFWLALKQKDLVGFPQSVKHGVWERVSGCWHRLSEALVYVSQAFS